MNTKKNLQQPLLEGLFMTKRNTMKNITCALAFSALEFLAAPYRGGMQKKTLNIIKPSYNCHKINLSVIC